MLNTEELTLLRRKLHQHPEPSGKEKATAQRIKDYLKQYPPDHILEGIGGHGLLALYESGKEGSFVAFRCDMDALPIEEENDLDYRSENDGVSHKCGHDGHMAMVSGLAQLYHHQRPHSGTIGLLYQPAEETGEGAAAILADEQFKQYKPDFLFGLHNLPGLKKNLIIHSNGNFAAASKGMIIKLKGATSHAAEPEKGKSPALAMAEIMEGFTLMHQKEKFQDTSFITVIHSTMGEIAFGTTPGYGEIRATLRTFDQDDMEKLTERSIQLAKESAKKYDLKIDIDWTEVFPATNNNTTCNQYVIRAADRLKLDQKEISSPFKWSEDFGHYSQKMKTAFFGLGAGENNPSLHDATYDFPDDIIESGTMMFYEIAEQLTRKD